MSAPLARRGELEMRELSGLLQPFASMIADVFTAAGHSSRAFKDFRPSFATQWQGR
jgi:hypothetical protein